MRRAARPRRHRLSDPPARLASTGAAAAPGARGLAVEAAVLHRPDVASPRELVPLEREGATRVAAPWKRALAGALFRLGAGSALRTAFPGAALVARRPGARQQLAWFEQAGASPPARAAVISSSWRPHASSVVVSPLTEESRPSSRSSTWPRRHRGP